MLRFEGYADEYLPELLSVFRSNVPLYFLEHEEKDLVADIPDFKDTYFVMRLEGEIIGAGGYALNEDDTVSLCWGMVHRAHHKKGLGKVLLQFRMAEIAKSYPGKVVVNTTSQHNIGFFEKFGFKLVSMVENGIGPGLNTCEMELIIN